MKISVQANVRTTEASSKGLGEGLSVAFQSGAVTGMLVVGLALIGLGGYYALLTQVGLEPAEPALSSTRWSPSASALR